MASEINENSSPQIYLTSNKNARKILQYLKHRKTATGYQIAIAVNSNANEIHTELDSLEKFEVIKSEEDSSLDSTVFLITGYGHRVASELFHLLGNH